MEGLLVQVLGLPGFPQACGVGRFDADEHPAEVGVAKQLQQILVLSHVERGFGAEAESVIVLVLIFLEEGEKLLSNRQVSNQIVIHEEGIVDLEAAQSSNSRPTCSRL